MSGNPFTDTAVIRRAEHHGRMVRGYMTKGSRARLEWLIDRYDVRSVVEVGSYQGLSACFFAERVESVVCVDHFDLAAANSMSPNGAHPEDLYGTFLTNTLAYPNIRSIRLPSQDAARLPVEADLVFIDAGHTFADVVTDIRAWKPHARKVLCGDDNNDTRFDVGRAREACGIPDSGERVWWQAL